MHQRTATILALCAATIGALLALYQGVTNVSNLARLGLPIHQLTLQFLANNDWISYGYIFLFAVILFAPRAQRYGAVGIIVGALIRLFFSVRTLFSILIADALQLVGGFRYVFFFSPVWALTILVFSILWAVNPNSRAVRITALVVGLQIIVSLILSIILNSFDVFMIVRAIIAILIASWFVLLFSRSNIAIREH